MIRSCEKLLVVLVTLILTLAFLVSVFLSIRKWTEQPTGTKLSVDGSRHEMPDSLTVCGWYEYRYPPNMSGWNFHDFHEFGQKHRFVVKAGWVHEKSYQSKSDSTVGIIQQDFLNEITLLTVEPFTPFWCNTIDWPKAAREAAYHVVLVNKSLATGIFMEPSQSQKARIYAGKDYIGYIVPPLDGYGRGYNIDFQTAKFIKDCDPESKLLDRRCFSDYITSKMGCLVPWASPPLSQNGSKFCSTSQELEKYLELRLEVHRGQHNEGLEQMACISQTSKNCVSKKWPHTEMATFDKKIFEQILSYFQWDIETNKDTLLFLLLPSSKIEILEEYYTYDLNNLIAEIGGYMGLFLGASLLSIFGMLQSGLNRLFG